MKRRYGGVIAIISVCTVLAIAFYGGIAYVHLEHTRVVDQLRVWNYKPTAAITEQIRRDNMSDEGRFLYLASHPKVESKRDFNQTCGAATTDSSVLGCYLKETKRIYLFHETDKRVDGTEEVMGARELLRAAWDRMSTADHRALLVELRRVLRTNTDGDLELSQQMVAIDHNDSADYNAELYATVGSEVVSVGPTLEKSYGRYFTKRSVVTALNAHASAYIRKLRDRATALIDTMTTLQDTITARIATEKAAITKLRADISSFNSRARTIGGFASQGQFNVARASLISRQNSLKAIAVQINAQIDGFNTDLTTLHAIVKIALSLATSLNIEFEPIEHIIPSGQGLSA